MRSFTDRRTPDWALRELSASLGVLSADREENGIQHPRRRYAMTSATTPMLAPDLVKEQKASGLR